MNKSAPGIETVTDTVTQQYTWVKTGDGSPSLQIDIQSAEGKSEKMHSWEGAFSETQYIYGEVVRRVAAASVPLKVFSLGLGLAYNELLVASEVVAGHAEFKHGTSTESDPWLISEFMNWLAGKDSALQEPYDEVAELFAGHKNVSAKAIRETFSSWVNQGTWKLSGSYGLDFDFHGEKFNAIFYDAFSVKVTPDLWTEEIILKTLNSSDKICAFGTYASRGVLKRGLKSAGFELMDRVGYGRRKESTLALKGIRIGP